MNEKDKAAFETAYSAYEKATNPELAGCKWTGMKLFEKALTHRDEQIKGLVEVCEKAKQELHACQAVLWQLERDGVDPAYGKGARDAISGIEAALAAYKEQTK